MACNCVGVVVNIDPPCPVDKNCVRVPSLLVAPSDSVEPCGAAGTLDVGAKTTSPTGAILQWTILSADDIFATATINNLGVISFTFTSEPIGGDFGEIVYAAVDTVSGLGGIGTANIGVKNLCPVINECNAGEICDYCTGNCVTPTPDVVLT